MNVYVNVSEMNEPLRCLLQPVALIILPPHFDCSALLRFSSNIATSSVTSYQVELIFKDALFNIFACVIRAGIVTGKRFWSGPS
jgi:hypothetical protein